MPAATAPGGKSAGVSSQPALSAAAADEFTRLHITPLDVDLLKVIVPASALPRARNISYHTIETFPEKRYGFVELPKADADKLRAKLNGAVLKGSKVRIERARPETKIEPADMDMGEKKSKKDKKTSKDGSESSKKRKREDNVVDGVALTDRKVKRGWTETPGESAKRKKKDKSEKGSNDKEKKKRTKSKYTEQEECLLKTKVPPNAMNNVSKDDSSHKKRKKNKGSSREVTVHEFERTTKFPSFLKDSSSGSARPAATEYVEGKGWVDESGNTVEAVAMKKPTKPKNPAKSAVKKKPVQIEEDSDDTSSSGASSEGESEVLSKEKKQTVSEGDSDTSSSGSSDDEEEAIHKSIEYATPIPALKGNRDSSQPASSPTSRNLKIKIPPPSTPSDDKVHPLEALYKRKKPNDETTETPAQKLEPFTFFGNAEEEGDDEDEGDRAPMPMTPFTRQDFEWRNVRSAAPTPDTAHPARMQNIWSSQQDDDMEDIDDVDEEDDNDVAGASTSGKTPSSDFQSWFWENRRELNQSWMKRRKTAAKEKRHRENKAKASRAV